MISRRRQNASEHFKHLQEVTHVYVRTLLLKQSLLKDVSNETPTFDVVESSSESFLVPKRTS